MKRRFKFKKQNKKLSLLNQHVKNRLRKIMDKNTLPLQNTYKFKDIIKQFEIQKPITIQDLQIEIKQIEELKIFTKNIDSRLQNIEN